MANGRLLLVALVFAAALSACGGDRPAADEPAPSGPSVRLVKVVYRAHDGLDRNAWLLLPRWYGPRNHPPIPLVISPHGRGVSARANVRIWGDLPSVGRFAVVNPEGQGRRLTLYAWGDPGDIHDLARMPDVLSRALPWLRIDRGRVYAFGGSMGGQETLLLVATHPRLLAGAASFDAPTNLAARYYAFPQITFGRHLQQLARIEVGGTPANDPRAYAIRSPLEHARQIAFSGVPLQIWWSTRDRIVTSQRRESGLLYRVVKRLNPRAPVIQVVGTWRHTAEMRATTRLPIALGYFGLLPPYRTHAPGLAR